MSHSYLDSTLSNCWLQQPQGSQPALPAQHIWKGFIQKIGDEKIKFAKTFGPLKLPVGFLYYTGWICRYVWVCVQYVHAKYTHSEGGLQLLFPLAPSTAVDIVFGRPTSSLSRFSTLLLPPSL